MHRGAEEMGGVGVADHVSHTGDKSRAAALAAAKGGKGRAGEGGGVVS